MISAFSLIKVVYMGKVKLAVEAIYLLYKQKNKFCILSELSRQRFFFFSSVNSTNHHSSTYPFASIKHFQFLPARSVKYFKKSFIPPNLEP